MYEIFIYKTAEEYNSENPTITINGVVQKTTDSYIEIRDENYFIHKININAVFAVVHK